MEPTYTALFPKADYAKSFADRITQPGWYAVNVVHKGRKVTWDAVLPESHEGPAQYAADMRETVGFYGSTRQRKATLNGIPCPVSY